MFKKSIIAISIAGVLVGSVSAVDYFVDDVDIYDSVLNLLNKVDGLPEPLVNSSLFTPVKVKGNLKASESIPARIAESKVISGDTVITIPLYTSDTRDTFNQTVFASDGSFYISVSNTVSDATTESYFKVYNLGRSEPKVVEIRLPDTKVTLYIQCYTPEALAFFTSSDIKNLEYKKIGINFSKTSDDDIASSTSINKKLYPKKEDMHLDEVYIEALDKFHNDLQGYSDFIEYEGKYLIYYKAIGFLDTRMKIEYAKLTMMGYTPIEVGMYKGISYIKFKELTVLGTSLTKNSCLIYHVSNIT